MTHPFHPLAGRSFELLALKHNWGEYRVVFRGATGEMQSLPAAWTDVAAPDPWLVVGQGRLHFRIPDLQAAVRWVRAQGR